MDDGQWTKDDGQKTMDDGQWMMDKGISKKRSYWSASLITSLMSCTKWNCRPLR